MLTMGKLLQLYLESYRGLSKSTWMLSLVMLINRVGAMVIPFLGIYMTQSLQFSLKEAGTVLSCFGLGAVVGSWFGGYLSDRFEHFKIQLYCLFLCIPVFCLLPELKTPVYLSIGVFVLSLITETFRPANSVAIASYTRKQYVTKAFSLNRMAMNLGFSIGPALGGFLAAFSYHWLFYGNAMSSGLAGLIFYFFFKSRRFSKKQRTVEAVSDGAKQHTSPWKDKYFMLFSVLCCIYSICFFQLLSTLPLFYRTIHQLSEWDIGLILAFSGLVVFSLEMLIVHIAENKISDSAAIILGTFLCGLSFSILVLQGGYLLLYFSMFLLCISEILAMPFMASVTMKRAPRSKQGAYMGVNALSFSIAHILSPYIGTRVAYEFGFSTLWASTGIIIVLACVAFWWVMRRM